MKNNQPVSTEKVYFWNLLGNLAFAGSSVLFTLIVRQWKQIPLVLPMGLLRF